MDGSTSKLTAPVRQQPTKPKANRSFTRSLTAVKPSAFTDFLVFDPAALAPPPPSGSPDNLLKASVKDLDIILRVPLPDKCEFTDTVQLLLNDAPAGPVVAVDPFMATGTIELTLSAAERAKLPEGTVFVNYLVVYASSTGEIEKGPPGQFYITDYTAPGDPFLGALVFSDEAIKNGVTPAALVTENGVEYLPARVPSYKGLAPGDVITGIVDARNEVIDAVTVGDGEIELRFTRSFIETSGDGSISFSWQAADRAGNVSKPSEPVALQVLLKGALPDLLTPRVPSYDDDPAGTQLITEADARASTGVLVEIPGNAGILLGDTVIVHWGAANIGPTSVKPGQDPVAVVGIPYAVVAAGWAAATGGADASASVVVTYDVLRNNIVAGTPKVPDTVQVNLHQAGSVDPDPETPVNENLDAPLVISAGGTENEIPADDFDQDAKVTIAWTIKGSTDPVFKVGDVLTVVYGGVDLAPVTIDADPAADVIVTLPAATIGTVGSGSIAVSYRIDRLLATGETNTSMSPTTTVPVHGTDELPGGGKLEAGTVPEAIGNYPAKPDRLLLGKQQGKDGTDFIIPPYKNQKSDDIITINLTMFRSFYEAGHAADLKVPERDITRTLDGPFDPTKEIKAHYTEVELMRYDLPTRALHGHFSYTIAPAADPERKVTSPDLLVDIDPRGD